MGPHPRARAAEGEALGLIEPDDGWQFTDEDTAVIDLEWQLQRVGGHPLTHKQVLKADGWTERLTSIDLDESASLG